MRLETRILMGCVVLAAVPLFGCAASDGVALFESVEGVAPAEDRARSRGVAWGDFDGDGDPDLFVTRATYDSSVAPRGNVLYRNDGDGRFSRVDAAPTTDREGDAEGAVWVDIDNDGDLDLHVVGRTGAGSILYENGGATLTRRNVDPLGDPVHSASMACWADVDVDGWLDVFIVGYGDDDNALFRNVGDWDLRRVALPDAARGSGDGRACSWGDLDGDDLPELVVAMARRPNLLLRNRGGFELVADTTTALHADDCYGYGLSWTDVNGDGARDLFVANSDAANAFYIGSGEGDLVPSELGEVLASAASKGHTWGDFDLNGREDLYLGSGTPAPGMLNRLYIATDAAEFRRVESGAALQHADTSAAVAAADYDLDGDLDLFVANWGSLTSRNRLYRNTTPTGSWIRVQLEGVRSNRMGVGSRVSVLTAASRELRWQHRWLDATTGYAGQDEPVLHFGLGSATRVDSLVVQWPSGAVDRMGPLPVGVVHTVREGDGAQPVRTAAYEVVGARWFDGTGFVDRTMYVVGTTLHSRRPERVDSVIDLDGAYVIPPLAEAHQHDLESPESFDSVSAAYLRAGVHYVAVQSDVPDLAKELKERAATATTVDAIWAHGATTMRWRCSHSPRSSIRRRWSHTSTWAKPTERAVTRHGRSRATARPSRSTRPSPSSASCWTGWAPAYRDPRAGAPPARDDGSRLPRSRSTHARAHGCSLAHPAIVSR